MLLKSLLKDVNNQINITKTRIRTIAITIMIITMIKTHIIPLLLLFLYDNVDKKYAKIPNLNHIFLSNSFITR